MPAPSNTTALTATDLGSTFPVTYTQRVDDAGTTYTVWFKFTAPAGAIVASAFAFGDLSVYKPLTKLYLGPAASPTLLAASTQNVPLQNVVTPGSLYLIECVTNAGNPTPANLTLKVALISDDTIESGSIFINDDSEDFPAAIIDSATGEVTGFITPFPAGEHGAVIRSSGRFMVSDEFNNLLMIYEPDGTLIIQIAAGGYKYIASTATHFWVSNGVGVKQYDPDGNLVQTVAGPLAVAPWAIGVNRAGTILYYVAGAANRAIRRWDLVTNAALSDFVPALASYIVTQDILTFDDDSVLFGHHNAAAGEYLVKRYSAAGALLNTYSFIDPAEPFGNNTNRLALGTAQDHFWVWIHDDSGVGTNVSNFYKVRVSDGTILLHIDDSAVYELGVYQGSPAADAPQFGHSFSCPMLIMGASDGGGESGGIDGAGGTTTHIPVRLRRAPHQSNEQGWIFYNGGIQIDLEAGRGLDGGDTVQGHDPKMMLRWSDDGGHTWSNEYWRSGGKIGEYKRRAIWRRLGRSRDRVYEVRVSDPVAWNLIDAILLDPKPGIS